MSWSVSASGKPAEVKTELDRQFLGPLADPPAGLSDEGERETVKLVSGVIVQCLETFDPEGKLTVSAYGHISGQSGKPGACQNVNLTITPSS